MIFLEQENNIKQFVENILQAGVHHGHKSKDLKPKMAPYISNTLDNNQFFDLNKTLKFLKISGYILAKKYSQKKTILIVGTSKVASNLVKFYAKKANLFYINYRWLGGMLTNWSTLKKRVENLKKLEKEVESHELDIYSKKIAAKKRKTLEKLTRLFEGVKEMQKLPDIIIFTSQIKEKVAILECQKLGIPMVCLVDSNCEPDLVTYPIPANDDAPSSINFVLNYLIAQILKN